VAETDRLRDSSASPVSRTPPESVGDVGAGHLARLVDLGDVDLNRGVVLGRDEAVGRTALARDVEVDDLALFRGGRRSISCVLRPKGTASTLCPQHRNTLCLSEGAEQRTWSFCMVSARW
jgi:hypothetical protein